MEKTRLTRLLVQRIFIPLFTLGMGLLVGSLLLYKALWAEPQTIPPEETTTPAPTVIPFTAQPVSIRGLEDITFEVLENKAAPGELIYYRFSVTNGQAETLSVGYVGVAVLNNTGTNIQFRTSWANQILTSGQTENWSDSLVIDNPGEYQLQLAACFPSVEACDAESGEWEDLALPVVITIIEE